MSQLIASYTTYLYFDVPKDVKLLPLHENTLKNIGVAGSWHIQRDTLYYYNNEGKQIAVKGTNPTTEYKSPNAVELTD